MRRIGFVGLGAMGTIMARRLLEAGFELTVHNRTRDRSAPLIALGARWAPEPCSACTGAELVISMLADDEALLGLALGEGGLLTSPPAGLVYVDMSTVSVSASLRVAEAAKLANVPYLRAPVTGSTVLADSGQLGILVSGPEAALAAARGALEVLGSSIFLLGQGEEARIMKLALNLLVAHTVVGLGEALVFGSASGLCWPQMLEVFAGSAVGSPLVRYKAPTLQHRDYRPAFTTEMMGKDLDLALDVASGSGAALPLAALCREMLRETTALGFGGHDFSAVAEHYEHLLEEGREVAAGGPV